MAVEKVTIQQAAGDLLKGSTPETTADTNSFNKVNPFLLGEKTLEQAQKALGSDGQYSAKNKTGLLFGSKIVNEEPTAKKIVSEVPIEKVNGSFGVLSNLTNFVKNVKYGVNQYDAVVTPNVKEALGKIPNRTEIEAAILANKRIDAIMHQAGLI